MAGDLDPAAALTRLSNLLGESARALEVAKATNDESAALGSVERAVEQQLLGLVVIRNSLDAIWRTVRGPMYDSAVRSRAGVETDHGVQETRRRRFGSGAGGEVTPEERLRRVFERSEPGGEDEPRPARPEAPEDRREAGGVESPSSESPPAASSTERRPAPEGHHRDRRHMALCDECWHWLQGDREPVRMLHARPQACEVCAHAANGIVMYVSTEELEALRDARYRNGPPPRTFVVEGVGSREEGHPAPEGPPPRFRDPHAAPGVEETVNYMLEGGMLRPVEPGREMSGAEVKEGLRAAVEAASHAPVQVASPSLEEVATLTRQRDQAEQTVEHLRAVRDRLEAELQEARARLNVEARRSRTLRSLALEMLPWIEGHPSHAAPEAAKGFRLTLGRDAVAVFEGHAAPEQPERATLAMPTADMQMDGEFPYPLEIDDSLPEGVIEIRSGDMARRFRLEEPTAPDPERQVTPGRPPTGAGAVDPAYVERKVEEEADLRARIDRGDTFANEVRAEVSRGTEPEETPGETDRGLGASGVSSDFAARHMAAQRPSDASLIDSAPIIREVEAGNPRAAHYLVNGPVEPERVFAAFRVWRSIVADAVDDLGRTLQRWEDMEGLAHRDAQELLDDLGPTFTVIDSLVKLQYGCNEPDEDTLERAITILREVHT